MPRVGRLLPAVFVTTGNPDTVVDSAVTTTNVGSAYDTSGQLGAVFRSADGLSEWIYCQFSATATGKATAKNQILFWMSSTTTTLTPTWVVDNQTSANTGVHVNQVAGILRTTSTSLGGKYIWALRRAGTSVNVVSTTTLAIKGDLVIATTASGEASTVSSTSTIAPAGGISASPWFWLGAGAKLGYVNSTATSSVNLDVFLDIQ